MSDEHRYWRVEYSYPTIWEQGGQKRMSMANRTAQVLAASAERAIARVKQEQSDATIWAVHHVGDRGAILIDDEETP